LVLAEIGVVTRSTRLRGGGCSPDRTGLQLKFPTGKLTGNFADSGPLQRFSRLIIELIQWLADKFPTQANREFLEA
jgi:hypothetical protein